MLRMTFKEDGMNTYVSLEEQCGKVWNVVTFFNGILDSDKLNHLEQFSLCFGIDKISIQEIFVCMKL